VKRGTYSRVLLPFSVLCLCHVKVKVYEYAYWREKVGVGVLSRVLPVYSLTFC